MAAFPSISMAAQLLRPRGSRCDRIRNDSRLHIPQSYPLEQRYSKPFLLSTWARHQFTRKHHFVGAGLRVRSKPPCCMGNLRARLKNHHAVWAISMSARNHHVVGAGLRARPNERQRVLPKMQRTPQRAARGESSSRLGKIPLRFRNNPLRRGFFRPIFAPEKTTRCITF